MIKRTLLPLLVLVAVLLAAPAANAKVTVGLGDQNASTFSNPLWKDLKLKKVRYLVPWDAIDDQSQLGEVEGYLNAAKAARQEVFVHFTALRGCFPNGKYSKDKRCRKPSVSAYKKAVTKFHKRFKYIKVFGAWNEANSPSQPTYKDPKRAAQYGAALKKVCRKCKVVVGDLLDIRNLKKYATKMNRTLKGRGKLWGLHNYGDVNRHRTSGTTTLLKIVPGEVWMTETGGISKFTGSPLKATEAKAGKAIGYMFSLARKYGSRKRGLRSKVARLYPYDFGPSPASARFDASLLAPDGSARKSYTAFKKGIKKFKR